MQPDTNLRIATSRAGLKRPRWYAKLADWTALNNTSDGLGPLRWLGPAITLDGTGWLWYRTRAAKQPPLALGLLTLIALLSGPIAWDHYASWSLLVPVLIADHTLWSGLTDRQRRNLGALLLIGGILIGMPMFYFAPPAIAAFWWLRLFTGTKTIGLMLWLGVGFWLLRHAQLNNARACRAGDASATIAPGTMQ